MFWVVALAVLASSIVLLVVLTKRDVFRRHTPSMSLPAVPVALSSDVIPPTTGLYVGTSNAGDWRDRANIVSAEISSKASLRLTPEGLLIERILTDAIWIAAKRLRGARIQRVTEMRDHIVVVWELDGHLLDTALREIDSAQDMWLEAIRSLSRL